MSKRNIGLLAAILTALSSCTLSPKYARPAAPVPATFPSGPAYDEVAAGAPVADILPWREFFGDERLVKLIEMALETNRALRVATLNVERSRARYGIQRAELLPTVDATASGVRERVPGDLSATGSRATAERYSVDLGVAAWEIDFFGRLRSLEAAALEEFFATQQARASAQILLVSEVASAYLNLAADRENLKLAQTTLATQQDAYDLVRRRYERGVVPELDVHRAQTQVDVARRASAEFTQQVARDENALQLLVGSAVPDELLPAELSEVKAPMEVAAGLPSEVLLRRPDVLEAENLLRAANANIGAARAAFFPRISLTAAIGTASSDLMGLFESGSGTWTYGPQVVMPIFDARIWAATRVAKADRKIAVAQYERAIQTSFREVADALAVRGTVDEQVTAQESLVRAVSETYRLSNARYLRGIDDYLGVLDAQRSLYAAQRELVLLRLVKLVSQVRLYSVLGGGAGSS